MTSSLFELVKTVLLDSLFREAHAEQHNNGGDPVQCISSREEA